MDSDQDLTCQSPGNHGEGNEGIASPAPLQPHSPSPAIQLDLSRPWEGGDLDLVVEGQSMKVSREVLRVSSPVFRAMLEPGKFQEGGSREVCLPGKKYTEVLQFMQVLHPTCITLADCDIGALLSLAREYMTDHVTFRCEEYLLSQPIKCSLTLELAEQFSLSRLRESCLSTLSQQFNVTNLDLASKAMRELQEAEVSHEAKSFLYGNMAEQLLHQLKKLRAEFLKQLETSADICQHLEDRWFCGKKYTVCAYVNPKAGVIGEHHLGDSRSCPLCSLHRIQRVLQATMGKPVTHFNKS